MKKATLCIAAAIILSGALVASVHAAMAPSISNVNVNIGGIAAEITWTTDVDSYSSLQFGTTSNSLVPAYGGCRGDVVNVATKNHCIGLTGLLTSTTYYFVVGSNNAGGTAYSNVNSFVTAAQGPPPPSGFASFLNGDIVTLSWYLMPGADRYNVYRSISTNTWPTTPFYSGGPVIGSSVNLSTQDQPGGGTWYYKIRACSNVAGCSADVILQNSVAVPAIAPAYLDASSSVDSVTKVTSINLGWPYVQSAHHYELYKKTPSADYPSSLSSPSFPLINAVAYADGVYSYSPVEGPGSYYFKVRACFPSGMCSATVESQVVTIASTPAAPTAPTSLTATTAGTVVTLLWPDVQNETRYELYRNSVLVRSDIAANTTSYPDTVPSPGSYSYYIKACNSTVCSSPTYLTGNSVIVLSAPALTLYDMSSTFGHRVVAVKWPTITGSTYYQVWRNGTAVGSTYDVSLYNSGGYTYYYDEYLSDGTYSYVVGVCNATGCSGQSNPKSITFGSAPAAPSAPTGVSAAISGTSTITVSWNSVGGANYYALRRKMGSGSFADIGAINVISTNYQDAAVYPNYTFSYVAYACIDSSNCSSASASTTPILFISPPSTISVVTSTASSVSLQWSTVLGAYTYMLYRGVNGGTPAAISTYIQGPTYTDPTVIAGNKYTYYAVACGEQRVAACSSPSPYIDVSPTNPTAATPTAPANLTSTASGGYVTLSWSDVLNESRYELYRRSTSTWGTVSTTIAPGTGGTKTYVDGPIDSGYYDYFVQACNSTACSSATYLYGVYNPPVGGGAVPGTPSSITVDVPPGASYANVSWGSVSGATFYAVYRHLYGDPASPSQFASPMTTSTTDYPSSGAYEYSVKACNQSGTCSAPTAPYGPVPVGTTYSASNFRTANVAATSAQVLWDSNVPALSSAFYYLGGSSNWTRSNAVCDQGGYVLSHCVKFNNLTPGLHYAYRVNGYFVTGSSTSAEQWFDTPQSVGTAVPTITIDLRVDNATGTVTKQAPATYTVTWNTTGNPTPTACVPSGAWSLLAGTFTSNGVPGGSYSFGQPTPVTVTGLKTYTLTCSNSVASASSTVYVNVVSDTTPPAGITDLGIKSATQNSIELSWTAPGDDNASGTAASYDVRYATSSVTDATWAAGERVTAAVPAPLLAGTKQGMIVGGLSSGKSYYFGIKSADAAGNVSPLSNSPQGTTQPATPTPTSTSQQVLVQDAFLMGTVVDARGGAVAGASVHIEREGNTANYTVPTNASGTFQALVPSGSYELSLLKPQNRDDLALPPPLSVSIATSETKTVQLKFLENAKIISGTVQFPNGDPVTDALVGAFSKASNQYVVTSTNAAGKFALATTGGVIQVNVLPKDQAKAAWIYADGVKEVTFSGSGAPELLTVNFSVRFSDAKLLVHVMDNEGHDIPGAGVTIDTVGAGQDYKGEPRYTDNQRTDASGFARFNLQPGTYFLRASLSANSGFINPPEKAVILGAAENKGEELVFKKLDSVRTALIRGITKLQDGTPFGAVLVTGWSDAKNVEVRSDSKGQFEFRVPVNTTWHFAASRQAGSVPYKSSNYTVTISETTSTLDLWLTPGESLSAPVSVTQSANVAVVGQAQDGAKVSLAAGSAAATGTVSLSIKPTVEAPSQAAAKVVSTVYDVTVKDEKGNDVKTFTDTAEIVLPYDERALAGQGVTPESIVPSYYDETTGSWVKIDNYTIDKEKHVIIARVNHLTRFAIIAAADVTPPEAPTDIAVTKSVGGELLISWKNPPRDFHHAKIYRSLTRGSFGAVVANDLSSVQYRDGGLQGGTTYYYTVRAVDPAGNESTNKEQIAAVPADAVGASRTSKFARTLKFGSKGSDVILLQQILLKEGLLGTGNVTGYFGNLTRQAVILLQERYASEILKPAGLSRGTGIVGAGTRAKLNKLIP